MKTVYKITSIFLKFLFTVVKKFAIFGHFSPLPAAMHSFSHVFSSATEKPLERMHDDPSSAFIPISPSESGCK